MNPHPWHALVLWLLCVAVVGQAQSPQRLQDSIFPVGRLKPQDSQLRVAVGQEAPDFALPSVAGKPVSLSDYRGKAIVVLSFVPAAWTPVCSAQWPGYDLARKEFEKRHAVLLGLSVDSLPTLNAWVKAMGGLWFPVLSDFWPHGGVAARFGILRSDGTSERAVIVIDRQGIIRYLDVHDINERPDLGVLMQELQKLQ